MKQSTGALMRRFAPISGPYAGVLLLDLFCRTDDAVRDRPADDDAPPRAGRHGRCFPADERTALRVAALYIVLRLIDGRLYFMANIGHVMGARIETDMRSALFSHLQKTVVRLFLQTPRSVS